MSLSVLVLATSMVVGQAEERPTGPKEFSGYFDYFTGGWQGTIKTGDETQRCTWIIKATPDSLCHLVYEAIDGKHAAQLLYGFDPRSKKWKGVGFGTDGSHIVVLVDRPPRLKFKPEDSLNSRSRGFDADGDPTSSVAVWHILDQNNVRIQITKRTTGEEKEPDIVYDMKRQ